MINFILMDTEFDKIVDRMGMTIVNTCATNEHVTDAERNFRTIKDSTRCSVAEFWRIRIRVHTVTCYQNKSLFKWCT